MWIINSKVTSSDEEWIYFLFTFRDVGMLPRAFVTMYIQITIWHTRNSKDYMNLFKSTNSESFYFPTILHMRIKKTTINIVLWNKYLLVHNWVIVIDLSIWQATPNKNYINKYKKYHKYCIVFFLFHNLKLL